MNESFSSDRSGKRRRKDEDVHWRIRIAQANTFKTFMESIHAVLGECAFQVVKTPDFQGIVVENLDSTRVCLLQGRLSGDAYTEDNHPATFCIRMPSLIAFLRSVAPAFFVDLWCPKGSTDLCVLLYEPQIGTHSPMCKIKTLARTQEPCTLHELEFQIFVEIELQTFRTIIKTARDHHADTIRISVYTPIVDDGIEQGFRTNIFVISYDSEEACCEYPFQSATEIPDNDDGGPTIIKASESATRTLDDIPTAGERKLLYNGKFGCEPINNFVKNLERTCLTLSLAPERPLLLEYPLGSSGSLSCREGKDYIRFICAPRDD